MLFFICYCDLEVLYFTLWLRSLILIFIRVFILFRRLIFVSLLVSWWWSYILKALPLILLSRHCLHHHVTTLWLRWVCLLFRYLPQLRLLLLLFQDVAHLELCISIITDRSELGILLAAGVALLVLVGCWSFVVSTIGVNLLGRRRCVIF